MKQTTIDLRNIHTPGAAQVYIEYAMNFPAYYGRNLDAMYDMLTEISEPTLLSILRPAQLSEPMQAYFPRLARVLHDAQEANDRLQVVVDIVF